MNDAQKKKAMSAEDDRARSTVELRIEVVDAISAISAAAWDGCANPAGLAASNGGDTSSAEDLDQEDVYNPFISHSFLSALEESHSVGGRSGWQVQHLLVTAADGGTVRAAPRHLRR